MRNPAWALRRPAAFALVVAVILACGLVVSRMASAADHGPFSGKFELVPLFDAGHRPVLRNGHQDYAVRNAVTFRTDAGDLVTVFGGQTTDLASIPAIVWPLLPPDGPWAEAAVVHDSCYRTLGTFAWKGRAGRTRAQPYDRASCDEILREAMVALTVPDWKRVTIWAAVRAGGWAGWGR